MPNKSRVCVKSADANFGNDPIDDMTHFDETGRWMEWSKNEFPHRLAPEPPLALAVPLSRFTSRVGGGSTFYVEKVCTNSNRIA